MKKHMVVLFLILLSSCRNSEREHITLLLEQWQDKEILFPTNSVYTVYGRDTIDFAIHNNWKILTYVDSVGCTSCKLQLTAWKELMNEFDSLYPDSVQFIFFFHPRDEKEVYKTMIIDKFNYPVCIDKEDSLNKLNNFPSDIAFQTFFLDKDDRVKVIGNPIHNFKIRELYLKIIKKEPIVRFDDVEKFITEISVDSSSLFLGAFNWEHEQKAMFTLRNVGNNPLVIDAVSTSCGCAKVKFDRKPIAPGGSAYIDVIYRAEHSGYFDKSITVHCNVKSSPIMLRITGNAE